MPETSLGDRAIRPYVILVVAAAAIAYLYSMRTQAIFTCPGTGYGPDQYLAYCFADQYGDFDHGAFWFGLEPGIRAAAARAEVLILGNSRAQFGFSTDATDAAMAALGASHYLLGFAYWENYHFEGELLKQIRPKARAYIINVDRFFVARRMDIATQVMSGADERRHYLRKRLWQTPHGWICGRFASLCGDHESFYRSRSHGGYRRVGGDPGRYAVSYADAYDPQLVAEDGRRAQAFIASLPVDRRCILLTVVPSESTPVRNAQGLAQALGLPLVAPQPAGLSTFDHSHLDRPSAERWSAAFYRMAAPLLRDCLTGGGHGRKVN